MRDIDSVFGMMIGTGVAGILWFLITGKIIWGSLVIQFAGAIYLTWKVLILRSRRSERTPKEAKK